MTEIERQTCKWIREMMVDVMGDDGWLTVATDAGILAWVPVDHRVVPTGAELRALCEILIENSVSPEHCAIRE